MRASFREQKGATTDAVQKELTRVFRDELGETAVERLVPRQTIGTTSTKVVHGMPSIPTGWLAYSLEGDARVWQAAAADGKFLYLIASATVTCGIRVF
jgi:hypothetical protein